MNNNTQHDAGLRADDGFGLVEVIVSMVILAVIAIAFLPVLIQGMKQSVANSTLATATQLVNEKLQLAQASGPTCSNVSLVAGQEDFIDEYGVTIRVVTTVGTCPVAVGTIEVAVTTTRLDTSAVLAKAETLVFVQ
jgi:prepilin-type N-terminal cleavage/methylation domain-containing protein